ncbi:hypothetical protein F5146DRAFT_997459 [Armillaria mellea]|nr:hypothetical protein F5146DRAFT_997459 [Armillaria mellea]
MSYFQVKRFHLSHTIECAANIAHSNIGYTSLPCSLPLLHHQRLKNTFLGLARVSLYEYQDDIGTCTLLKLQSLIPRGMGPPVTQSRSQQEYVWFPVWPGGKGSWNDRVLQEQESDSGVYQKLAELQFCHWKSGITRKRKPGWPDLCPIKPTSEKGKNRGHRYCRYWKSRPYAVTLMPFNENVESQTYSTVMLYVLSASTPPSNTSKLSMLTNFVGTIKSSTSRRTRPQALPVLVVFFSRNLFS